VIQRPNFGLHEFVIDVLIGIGLGVVIRMILNHFRRIR